MKSKDITLQLFNLLISASTLILAGESIADPLEIRGSGNAEQRYLYQKVTQKMLRTHGGKYIFLLKKKSICDCSRSNQMPKTDQITDNVPNVRIYF